MSRARRNASSVGPVDPQLGLPPETQVIQCTSGPQYTVIVMGSSPDELRQQILRLAMQHPLIAAVVQGIEEIDEPLQMAIDGATCNRPAVQESIVRFRARLRKLLEAVGP